MAHPVPSYKKIDAPARGRTLFFCFIFKEPSTSDFSYYTYFKLVSVVFGTVSAQYVGSREINKLYVLTTNSATLHTFTSHPVCVLLTFSKTCPELTVQSTSVLTFCKLMIKVLSMPACRKSYLRAGRLVWDIKDYSKTLTPGSKLKFKWRHSKQTNTF